MLEKGGKIESFWRYIFEIVAKRNAFFVVNESVKEKKTISPK